MEEEQISTHKDAQIRRLNLDVMTRAHTHIHTDTHISTRTCTYTHIHTHTHTQAGLLPALKHMLEWPAWDIRLSLGTEIWPQNTSIRRAHVSAPPTFSSFSVQTVNRCPPYW